jgi:hypothetical protein
MDSSWGDEIEPAQLHLAKGREHPVGEAVAIDLPAVEARFGIPFGPVMRNLLVLAMRSDPSEPASALGYLGPKRRLSLDLFHHAPADIEPDARADLRPFATDHKSYLALSVAENPSTTDHAAVFLIDWEEDLGPRRIAGNLRELLHSWSHAELRFTDAARHRDAQRMQRNLRRLCAALTEE